MGNTPKLRFEGYSENWNQHTLSDVFTQTSNFVNPKEDGVALWSLTVEDGLTPKTERYVREFLVKKDDKFKEVRPGDIVYNPMNMTLGAVGYNGMDESVAVSGYYTTMVAGGDYDAYFINTWLKSPQAILLYKTYATGTLLEKQRIQFPTLSTIPAVFPTRDEQFDIGTLFENIDKLIALYQHKYEVLARAKKFYLQNMFPRKGETTPKIRFAGFTDAWEQRKVGDITTELSEYANLSSGLPLLTSSRAGLMYQNEYRGNQTTDSDKTMFSVVPIGACTYRHMSDDDVFHLNINSLEKGLVSREYPVFSSNGDNNLSFLVQHLNSSGSFISFCKEQKKGGTRTRLYYNALCEFVMMVPSPNEQIRIANLIETLDTLITLHQRKVSTLQTMRKFLIQNMFV